MNSETQGKVWQWIIDGPDDYDILTPGFLLWMDQNVKGHWTHHFLGVHVRLYFEDPAEAMHCKLKWRP